jgi:hypothetical protein
MAASAILAGAALFGAAPGTAAATVVKPASNSPVLIGAGDVCVTSVIANAEATAALIAARPTNHVFTLGDNSNETGTASQYANCYAKAWGAFKSRTRPTVGNHDYMTAGAAPYYAYFGSLAGPSVKGYYSYNLANNWHVIVLNAICLEVGGCQAGSAQEKWLKADLAANRGKHIVAMWHIPSFSSGSTHGDNSTYKAWWTDLYAAHADLILDGHDHDYERFAQQSPAGVATSAGIREFVVGTGGASQRAFGTIQANSQVRSTGVFGVLKLTLGLHSYSWWFIPVAGKTFTDHGTAATHSQAATPDVVTLADDYAGPSLRYEPRLSAVRPTGFGAGRTASADSLLLGPLPRPRGRRPALSCGRRGRP